MEVVSGMNLDTFFDQWLYKGGNMVLDGNWKFDEKKGRIEVNLNQVQNDGYLFEMPVELGISYNDKNLEKLSENQILIGVLNPFVNEKKLKEIS